MDARLADDRDAGLSEPEAPFEMTSLRPRLTGLPMVVWVTFRGNARHDVRVKVMQTHGNRISVDDLAVMTVRPEPHLIEGHLSRADQELVSRWIKANERAILDHWDGETDGSQLADEINRVES